MCKPRVFQLEKGFCAALLTVLVFCMFPLVANAEYVFSASTVDPFVKEWYPHVAPLAKKYKFPIASMMAQAGWESGWGSRPACGTNYFGIKPWPQWKGSSCSEGTQEEYSPGTLTNIQDAFVKPADGDEKYMIWIRFLKENDRYKAAWSHPNDALQFSTEIAKASYATSSAYLDAITSAVKAIEASMDRQKLAYKDLSGVKDATDDKKDTSSKTSDDDGGKPLKEDELTGMPDRNDYSANSLKTPDGQLDGMQGYSLASLQENRSLEASTKIYQIIRYAIALMGILILLYGLALSMAWLFDKANTVIDLGGSGALGILTKGKLNLVKDRFDAGKTRVTVRRLIVIILICWLVGAAILTGALTGWILQAYWYIMDLLDK